MSPQNEVQKEARPADTVLKSALFYCEVATIKNVCISLQAVEPSVLWVRLYGGPNLLFFTRLLSL